MSRSHRTPGSVAPRPWVPRVTAPRVVSAVARCSSALCSIRRAPCHVASSPKTCPRRTSYRSICRAEAQTSRKSRSTCFRAVPVCLGTRLGVDLPSLLRGTDSELLPCGIPSSSTVLSSAVWKCSAPSGSRRARPRRTRARALRCERYAAGGSRRPEVFQFVGNFWVHSVTYKWPQRLHSRSQLATRGASYVSRHSEQLSWRVLAIQKGTSCPGKVCCRARDAVADEQPHAPALPPSRTSRSTPYLH